MNQLAWDHWHIEPSSLCTLKCPRCPRAEVPESLLNRQLDLNFFKNQIGSDTVSQIKKITFCGNDGDPIYCKDLLHICSWLKQSNPDISIVLITNGSYKKTEWWIDLANILNHNDEVQWSLDGWDQSSNEQYRKNCDWTSVVNGIKIFNKHNTHTYKVWASIAFRFNENNIEHQKNLAKLWQFDLYQLTKSTKFGSKYPGIYGSEDYLEPTQKHLIANSHRFERTIEILTDKTRPGNKLKELFLHRAQNLAKHNTHSGICLIGNKGVFLNSRGEFYPCCWTATRYDHNQYWHNQAKTKFNLYNKTFTEIMSDAFWQTDFLKFDSFECSTKCTMEKLNDLHHTTEW